MDRKTFNTHNISAEHAGMTVESYLKEVLQYSGRNIQKLTRQKGILLNGKSVYLQRKIKPQDTLRILIIKDTTCGVQPEKGTIAVLYEDEQMVVVNKPAYQLVHPSGRTAGGTLANHLAYHLRQRGISCTIRPVHRLDRNTSGCVIFAKDAHSQFLLEQQLKKSILKRKYWALVTGIVHPSSGTIDAPIGPHPSLPNRRAINKQGDQAVTHYRTVRSFPDASLLELTLDTGRTHQIRVHLAHIAHPVIGDGMYGMRVPWMPRQALHAASVSFVHLHDQKEVTVHAPLPPDFVQALEYVGRVP